MNKTQNTLIARPDLDACIDDPNTDLDPLKRGWWFESFHDDGCGWIRLCFMLGQNLHYRSKRVDTGQDSPFDAELETALHLYNEWKLDFLDDSSN